MAGQYWKDEAGRWPAGAFCAPRNGCDPERKNQLLYRVAAALANRPPRRGPESRLPAMGPGKSGAAAAEIRRIDDPLSFFFSARSAARHAPDTHPMSQNTKSRWLLLIYKVPSEPSRFRVAVWRRIRSLGAVYLQNGICVLPMSAEHERQLRIVQAEVEAAGGEAVIFGTTALDPKQEERVVAYFKHDRSQDYEEFLDKCNDYKAEVQKEVKASHYTFAELKENDEDLKKLKNWLGRIKAIDFYGAPERAAAERRLAECEEILEAYANEVFEREQNPRAAHEKPAAAKRAPAAAKRAPRGRK